MRKGQGIKIQTKVKGMKSFLSLPLNDSIKGEYRKREQMINDM